MSIVLSPVCVRTPTDDYAVSVDWSETDVFDSTAITSGTLATSNPSGLTLGAVTVAANVATFRVSGGTVNNIYAVTMTVTNGTDTLARTVMFDTR